MAFVQPAAPPITRPSLRHGRTCGTTVIVATVTGVLHRVAIIAMYHSRTVRPGPPPMSSCRFCSYSPVSPRAKACPNCGEPPTAHAGDADDEPTSPTVRVGLRRRGSTADVNTDSIRPSSKTPFIVLTVAVFWILGTLMQIDSDTNTTSDADCWDLCRTGGMVPPAALAAQRSCMARNRHLDIVTIVERCGEEATQVCVDICEALSP